MQAGRQIVRKAVGSLFFERGSRGTLGRNGRASSASHVPAHRSLDPCFSISRNACEQRPKSRHPRFPISRSKMVMQKVEHSPKLDTEHGLARSLASGLQLYHHCIKIHIFSAMQPLSNVFAAQSAISTKTPLCHTICAFRALGGGEKKREEAEEASNPSPVPRKQMRCLPQSTARRLQSL